MYGTVNVHEFIYSTSMTSVSLASIIKLSGAASSTQTKTTVFVIHYYVCQLLKEDKPRLIRTLKAL